MTKRTRRDHSGSFKAKVALAALRGDRDSHRGRVAIQGSRKLGDGMETVIAGMRRRCV